MEMEIESKYARLKYVDVDNKIIECEEKLKDKKTVSSTRKVPHIPISSKEEKKVRSLESMSRYYDRNKELLKEKHRLYYYKNREDLLYKQRIIRESSKEMKKNNDSSTPIIKKKYPKNPLTPEKKEELKLKHREYNRLWLHKKGLIKKTAKVEDMIGLSIFLRKNNNSPYKDIAKYDYM